MPYPSVGLSEDYIETPSTTKHGFIVPVTREAIFFDRTHLILQRAAEVGEVLGLNKEKRLLDLVIGAANNYKCYKHLTHYNSSPIAPPALQVGSPAGAAPPEDPASRLALAAPLGRLPGARRPWPELGEGAGRVVLGCISLNSNANGGTCPSPKRYRTSPATDACPW